MIVDERNGDRVHRLSEARPVFVSVKLPSFVLGTWCLVRPWSVVHESLLSADPRPFRERGTGRSMDQGPRTRGRTKNKARRTKDARYTDTRCASYHHPSW